MKEFFRHWSRTEQALLLTTLTVLNCVLWAEVAYFMDRAGIAPWQTNQPEPDGTASFEIPDGLLLTPLDQLPSAPTTIFPTQIPIRPPPTKEAVPIPENPFFVGPFNLEGIKEANRLQPAPPLFIFIKTPDGSVIKSYVYPKALESTDAFSTVFDPNRKVNPATLNVTGRKNGYYEGFVIQTGHSGSNPWQGDMPLESLRKNLEENGRPFTPDEFAKTVEGMRLAEIILWQGSLAPKTGVEKVDSSGKGLVNPATAKAKIKGIIRLDPQQTAALGYVYQEAAKKSGYVNVMDFFTSQQKITVNPQTDFMLEFCGQNTFPGEKRVAGIPSYQATKYFVAISIGN